MIYNNGNDNLAEAGFENIASHYIPTTDVWE